MPYDPTKDRFGFLATGLSAPARRLVAVTPNDATDLSLYPRALYVGGAGDLVVIPVGASDDTPVTLKAHPIGYAPIGVRRVLATGTGATNILALY